MQKQQDMQLVEAPTTNEIVGKRYDRDHPYQKSTQRYTLMRPKYRVGDEVSFRWSGVIRYGRITGVRFDFGLYEYRVYNSTSGTWYQGVDESFIIEKE